MTRPRGTPQRPSLLLVCLLGGLAASLGTACGRKGPVRPPEDVAPQTITDLRGSSTRGGIALDWSRPFKYVDGERMDDLAGFLIERASGGAPERFVRLARVPVTDQERFRQAKRFHYLDRDTVVGTTYRYRVVSWTLDRYFSAPSNVVTVERRAANQEPHAPLPATQR